MVIVDMKTAGMSGLIRGGATIGVQGLDQPTVELKLTATVVPDAAFDPPMLRIDETPIGAGGSGEVALIVRTPGSGVRSIVSSVPSFVAEAGEPEEIKIDATTGTKIPIRVRVGSELPAGYHVADLRVETTGASCSPARERRFCRVWSPIPPIGLDCVWVVMSSKRWFR